jgi:hypothetical protein
MRTCIIHLLFYIFIRIRLLSRSPSGVYARLSFRVKAIRTDGPDESFIYAHILERIARRNHLLRSSDKKKKKKYACTHARALVLYTYLLSQKVSNIHIRTDTHTCIVVCIQHTHVFAIPLKVGNFISLPLFLSSEIYAPVH